MWVLVVEGGDYGFIERPAARLLPLYCTARVSCVVKLNRFKVIYANHWLKRVATWTRRPITIWSTCYVQDGGITHTAGAVPNTINSIRLPLIYTWWLYSGRSVRSETLRSPALRGRFTLLNCYLICRSRLTFVQWRVCYFSFLCLLLCSKDYSLDLFQTNIRKPHIFKTPHHLSPTFEIICERNKERLDVL